MNKAILISILAISLLLASCSLPVNPNITETATQTQTIEKTQAITVTQTTTTTRTVTPTTTPTKPIIAATTPTSTPLTTTITKPTPTPTNKYIIEDLAYIKIFARGYTDDADPEPDGVSLYVYLYDSKSEGIIFQGIPVKVNIMLYGYRYININGYSFPDREKRELVYQKQTTQENSSTQIKIPFENMMVDRNKYYSSGDTEVTITTPKQGSFQAKQGLVMLYAE